MSFAAGLVAIALLLPLAHAQPSLTTYADRNCATGAKTLTVSAGLCYNSTYGDFIITSTTSNANQAWMAVNEYSDEACTHQVVTSAAFANVCQGYQDGWSAVQIRQSNWEMYYYSGCSDAECRGCTTNITVPPTGCVFIQEKGRYVRPVLLGLGAGAFQMMFFSSTDGSCRNSIRTVPVPDSTCFGEHALQMSSLSAFGGKRPRPHHPQP